jgi:D-beta-D-heptose 7-phosphate kinase/D-beta-D-heptose 1-phosphate adenosyltransferase
MVVGDVIMDNYIWGDVSRISPEAPVPVVDVKHETKMLGGAANVLRNMATLGARPILCGVVGEDPTGEEIIRMIEEVSLSKEGIMIERNRPTSIKTRVVARGQQVVRFDRESRIELQRETIDRLLQFVEKTIEKVDAIVVADYGKGVISSEFMKGIRSLVDSVRKGSIILAVDPKTGNFEHYRGVDVITPNHHEAGRYCRIEIEDEKSLVSAGKQMLSELKCRSVLITQGQDGMTLFEEVGEITHIPTIAKKVFDVTGAGDTVIGTLSLALASGLDMQSSAILSNIAAGIVVGDVGTSAVNADDLMSVIDQFFENN